MTKRTRIEEIYKEGKGPREIHEITGFSYGYISNVIAEIRHPGTYNEARNRWLARGGKKAAGRPETRRANKKRWKIRHPEKRADHDRQLATTHQNATLPSAARRYREWTLAEFEYLKNNGKTKSSRQLALELGRTYFAVRDAAHKFGINLRGNKMGANANRFRGTYKVRARKSLTRS